MIAVRHALCPVRRAGARLLPLLCALVIGSGLAVGADRTVDELDDKLIMADYAGLNPLNTIAARRDSLDKIAHSVVLKIHIREWPLKISVMDPTDVDAISKLRDGDRGFVWQMTRDQLQGFVAKLMPIRRTIMVSIEKPELVLIEEIKAWLAALRFEVVEIEGEGR